ncbi:hypothetical protein [Clostridium sp.]
MKLSKAYEFNSDMNKTVLKRLKCPLGAVLFFIWIINKDAQFVGL